ncbi:MAG: zf-HC2 domain-containing protein [Planctomycetota bacterium]|nr:zf-HC2 domain-containing protein [Planctomycetota bacterium]
MRCDQSERWISLGADQELSVQEVGLLQEHLAQCEPCRALADETRDLSRWFVNPPQQPVSAGFAGRVVAAAFDGQAPVASGPQELLQGGSAIATGASGNRMQGFLLQMTALAALLLVALGFALSGQKASQNTNLHATESSMDSMIEDLDRMNGDLSAPKTEQNAENKSENSDGGDSE